MPNAFADLIPSAKGAARGRAPSAADNRRLEMGATGEQIESANVNQAQGRTNLAVDVPTIPAQITSRNAGAVKDAYTAGAVAKRAQQGILEATQDEKASAYNKRRLEDSLALIQAAEKKDPNAETAPVLPALAEKIPVVGGMLANAMVSPERRQVVANQKDMLDAALYLATGAAYNKEQLAALSQAYIPQPGDDPATIKMKRTKMNNLIDAARIRAGTVGQPISPLGGSGPNVSPTQTGPQGKPLLSTPLPPQVAAQLKEGVETMFGNGQVWTKRNGVPTRVK